MICHAGGQFFLSKKYPAHPFLAQHVGFFFAMGSQHNFNRRIECARGIRHASEIQRIRCGDHQHRGIGDMGLDQYRRIGRIADHRRHALVTQVLHQLAILLDDQIGGMPRSSSASAIRFPTRP